MCGIAGLVGPGGSHDVIAAMTRCLDHRGPDRRGYYRAPDGKPPVFFGHTRLSILDLKSGDQPMSDAAGDLWLIYNGEIYNFRELRKELQGLGHRFRTRSDSEVIVEAYRAWGLDSLRRLDGMFAFALWDASRGRLVLARDLFGIKPLHFHFDGSTLRFASEIKAILQDPRVPRQLDYQALHWFLNLRYVPGDRTLFRGIWRLPPGHVLIFADGQVKVERRLELPLPEGGRHDTEYYAEGLRHHLREAVRKQLLSDVPLGIHLSGGLDSSSLVAMASELAGEGMPTFSLGFGEPTDELDDARVVARHFRTDHRETTLPVDPLRELPGVVWATEEPKENVLQGYLLARFVRPHVKVVLAGLGGDELLAGYTIHRLLHPTDRVHRFVPMAFQRALLRPASRALFAAQSATGYRRLDEVRRGFQFLLSMGDPCRSYRILRNAWDDDTGAFRDLYGPAWEGRDLALTQTVFEPFFATSQRHVVDRALWAELHTKMVDDFLLNEDRTSMANGIEVRVPFLDLDLVRFALSIPIDLKIRHNDTKWILRHAMSSRLPEHTIQKKKWGFGFDPYHQFQKDLKAVAERILTPSRVQNRGIFRYSYLRQIIACPPHPRLRWHYFMLWLAVGLEIWSQIFLDGDLESPPFDLEAYC